MTIKYYIILNKILKLGNCIFFYMKLYRVKISVKNGNCNITKLPISVIKSLLVYYQFYENKKSCFKL